MADDLQRYLDGKPISARPLSTFARSVRWCLRNPMHAASLLLLLITCIVSSVAWMTTSAALTRSVESHQETRQVVDFFLTKISEDALLDQPGMQPLRRELLNRARDSYQEFVNRRKGNVDLHEELGEAQFRLGLIELLSGDLDAAERSLKEALVIQQSLVERSGSAEYRVALSKTLTRLGEVCFRHQQFGDARGYYTDAHQVRRELVTRKRGNREYGRLLASAVMHLGMVDRATENHEEARMRFLMANEMRRDLLGEGAIAEIQRDLGTGLFNLGRLEIEMQETAAVPDRLEAAELAFIEASKLFEALATNFPNNLGHQQRLAQCWLMLAEVKSAESYEAAEKWHADVLPVAEKLAFDNPSVFDYHALLSVAYMNQGRARFVENELAAALEQFDNAKMSLELLRRMQPEEAVHQENLATTLRSIGEIEASRGNLSIAHNQLVHAKRIFDTLVNDYPGVTNYQAGRDEITQSINAVEEAMIQ